MNAGEALDSFPCEMAVPEILLLVPWILTGIIYIFNSINPLYVNNYTLLFTINIPVAWLIIPSRTNDHKAARICTIPLGILLLLCPYICMYITGMGRIHLISIWMRIRILLFSMNANANTNTHKSRVFECEYEYIAKYSWMHSWILQ